MPYRFESKQPEPIPVGHGDQMFTLRHKRLTGYEKIEAYEALLAGIIAVQRGVADAAGLGLSSVTHILWPKVIAWDGVQDSSGVTLPFKSQTEDGKTVSHLAEVMGSLPIEDLVRAVVLQLAINGLPLRSEMLELFTGMVEDPDFSTSLAKEAECFLSRRGGTADTCSTSSASGEPATPS